MTSSYRTDAYRLDTTLLLEVVICVVCLGASIAFVQAQPVLAQEEKTALARESPPGSEEAQAEALQKSSTESCCEPHQRSAPEQQSCLTARSIESRTF